MENFSLICICNLFTGFLSGLVIGMNLGIYWHFPLAANDNYFYFLESPVFFGLILGLILGCIGHWIEKVFFKKWHSSINEEQYR
jgi:H+/Cl- antiporter ClcA